VSAILDVGDDYEIDENIIEYERNINRRRVQGTWELIENLGRSLVR
jgi:hypothetical protein